MHLLTRPPVVALGYASLCLLAITAPLRSPSHLTIYHLSGSSAAVFLPVLIYFAALWLVLTLLFSIPRSWSRTYSIVSAGLLLAFPSILLKNYAVLLNKPQPRWIEIAVLLVTAILFVALQVLHSPAVRKTFALVQGFFAAILGFMAISGLLTLAQLCWFGWQARALNAAPQLHRPTLSAARTPAHGRVFWIVFDELSYRQLYKHRFAGLQLPAFDALAAQSTVFTDARPAGIATEVVLPSLFLSQPLDEISSSSDGRRVSLHNSALHQWQSFDPHQTVFQDALNSGYSTAVAGWYNPYCRILSAVLDRCFWSSEIPLHGSMFSGSSLKGNLLRPLLRVASILLPGFFRTGTFVSETATIADKHIDDYRSLYEDSDQILNDSHADFVLLHLPVPHPGGIYNRRSETFANEGGTYIDNLALADACLAHFQTTLERRGEWDSATVLVMGDHSWRTTLDWAHAPGWTPEEEKASDGGQFDDRPAYILKLPYQKQPQHIDSAYPAIRTRALLDSIFSGRIATSQQLSTWVGQ